MLMMISHTVEWWPVPSTSADKADVIQRMIHDTITTSIIYGWEVQ